MRPGPWREARLDVTSPTQVRGLIEQLRPGLTIYASYDKSRRDITVEGAQVAASATQSVGGRFVLISTDLVFDGSAGNYNEDMPAMPTMPYGQLKIEAEVAVRGAAPSAAILRPSLFWGESGAMMRPLYECDALSNGEPIDAYVDEWRSPVNVDDVARAVWDLGSLDVSDVFHLGGPERLTRYEIAMRLVQMHGFDPALVRQANRPADRPKDTSLDSTRLIALLGWSPVPMAAQPALDA